MSKWVSWERTNQVSEQWAVFIQTLDKLLVASWSITLYQIQSFLLIQVSYAPKSLSRDITVRELRQESIIHACIHTCMHKHTHIHTHTHTQTHMHIHKHKQSHTHTWHWNNQQLTNRPMKRTKTLRLGTMTTGRTTEWASTDRLSSEWAVDKWVMS